MASFVFISIIALYFYTYLMLAFMSAKKSKLINDFIAILGGMILWTGGSFLMRLRAWPAYSLWYHVSLAGILIEPYAFFCFMRDFCGRRQRRAHSLWLLLILTAIAYNAATDRLVAAPEIVQAGGGVLFVYHMTWRAVILYGVGLLILLHTAAMVWEIRREREQLSKVLPLLGGILILLAGNMAVPVFRGFPIDILSGVVNALIMFYTLYSKHLFKMTLLVSRGNCYVLAMGISAAVFYKPAQLLDDLIRERVPVLASFSAMLVAILAMLVTLLIYGVTKIFFDKLFIRENISRTERLDEFTTQVSQSLRMSEIIGALVTVLTNTLGVKNIYICVEDTEENERESYRAVYGSSPEDAKNFTLEAEDPLVLWMKSHDACLLMKEFKKSGEYGGIGVHEKALLEHMKIECILPLKDGEHLVGIVLLGGKEKQKKFKAAYTQEDAYFLNSIESVSSIAVRNSRLYEKAYQEARTDDLTGLLNRKCFYETLEEACEARGGASLALVILNVDDFKLYNQLYGTRASDQALLRIASTIREAVGEGGYCARYSGKEFAVLLPGCDIHAAQSLTETIAGRIRGMNQDGSDTYLKSLTVSCGICAIPEAASSPKELVANADYAVYRVKRSGKNGIHVYSEGRMGEETDEAQAERHKSMYSEYAPTIYALTAAIDARDHYTFQHSKAVAYYSVELGKALRMSEEYQEILRESALLHDIGKIGIPENVLNKKGKLTDEEYEIMKRHVEASVEIIRHLPSMDYVIPAVIGHHERYDGNGYPRRIAAKDIPLASRILCIADSFDAMLSKRSYKPGMTVDFAIRELEKGAGGQFDPELAPVFIKLVRAGTIVPIINKQEAAG